MRFVLAATITHNFDDIVKSMLEKAKDFRQPLTNFYGYIIRRTDLTFKKLSKKGSGTFRKVRWPWFADQYTRKDGTVVPAEGGVARADGKGTVKPRLRRHSKKPITANSRILIDRRRLHAAALSRKRISKTVAVFKTPVEYADEQQKLRPFAFITQKDADTLRRMITKHLVG